ncbi:hypothetical protein J8J27_32190, partial [Mycobacterium tuberculosis]|nr:hypothetical protein [Mycobacterium tuberculosis]
DLERNGQPLSLDVVPKEQEERFQAGVMRRGLIGLRMSTDPADQTHVRLGPGEAVVYGVARVGEIIGGSVRGLIGLTTGRTNPD